MADVLGAAGFPVTAHVVADPVDTEAIGPAESGKAVGVVLAKTAPVPSIPAVLSPCTGRDAHRQSRGKGVGTGMPGYLSGGSNDRQRAPCLPWKLPLTQQ